MGRAARKGTGSAAASGGARTSVPTSLPRPNKESTLLGLYEDCIIYYSPEEDRVFSMAVDTEILVHGGDRDNFPDEISNLEDTLLQKARKNLESTGEIGFVSANEDVDYDVYLGPSHDRMEERWGSRSVSLEGWIGTEDDAEIWGEDNPEAEKSLLRELYSPEAKALLEERENQG